MELLEMLEEPVSIKHICKHATLPDFEACRYLWAFRCLGWIELAELEATEPVPEPIATAATEPEIPKPAVPDPALAQTQVAMDIETPTRAKTEEPAPKAVPQDLVQTQPTVEAPGQPEAQAPPRPIPENLAQTQVALEPPAFSEPRTPEPPPAPTPTPRAQAPRPIPENLANTQLYMSHPSFEPPESVADPAPKPEPTTSDMLEAILDGEDSVPTPAPKAFKRTQSSGSGAVTRLDAVERRRFLRRLRSVGIRSARHGERSRPGAAIERSNHVTLCVATGSDTERATRRCRRGDDLVRRSHLRRRELRERESGRSHRGSRGATDGRGGRPARGAGAFRDRPAPPIRDGSSCRPRPHPRW